MKINNLASLRRETERLEYKIRVDASKLKTDFQLLRYELMEQGIKAVAGLFKKTENKQKSGTRGKTEEKE